jgi:hypothetical protein
MMTPKAPFQVCSVAQFNSLGMFLYHPELHNASPYRQKPSAQTAASRHGGERHPLKRK